MPIKKISKLLVKLFGSRNERLVKSYSIIAAQAGEFEEQVKSLSEDQLKEKTADFKSRLAGGQQPEQILPEVFAVVREAARRNVEMRHFDVQLVGGNVLYESKIAEMATGEGKTLVATLAAYLVHLTGKHVHIITVNDYLAKRDAEWMRPVYESLGMTVGAIQSDMDTGGDERRGQYGCDVCYGTNNEFGFDYLRDNMKMSLDRMVQGELEFTIIDEVDSILIDEARTPLIISGPAFDDVTRYKKADEVARKLMGLQGGYDSIKKKIDMCERMIANAQGEFSEAKKAKDDSRMAKAQEVIEKNESEMASAKARLEGATEYYEVEYDRKAVHLTHEGITAAQDIAQIGSFFTGSNMEWPHLLEQSLRAHVVFEKEKDYVVLEGKVVIVDEFTGRLMHGRQWSDGLHQAVEAKESVQVKEESQTLATITLQNFFKLYGQLSGMTGTAATEADEFMNIYKLDVVIIPTNKPCVRDDREDLIYKSIAEKFNSIADEVHEVSSAGRPVLVGTISIEKSEAMSNALTKKYGIEHEVLNAKQHAREAQIVLKAGQQHEDRHGNMRGNVTIATNMAGRGTDIKLGEGVRELGGLHILGTERHEARRIDNQLRGRAGRQGDAGSSQFFLCFEDDLMRLFAPEWTIKALAWIGWEEGQPIYNKRISKGIEKAQKKVEERNFDSRKSLIEYDEVMDFQRSVFYKRRREILKGMGLKDIIQDMISSTIEKSCATILADDYPLNCIAEWARKTFSADLRPGDIRNYKTDEIEVIIKEQAKSSIANEISLSIGEYLEDYSNPVSWDMQGLSKWAMSAFKVSLSPSKIKYMSPDEIEEQLIEASAVQIDKKDCSQLDEFLRDDFAAKTFIDWARAKFGVALSLDDVQGKKADEVSQKLADEVEKKYRRREIEYPVEFAMNMVYGRGELNVYAFESLSKWAKSKYKADLSVEELQESKPKKVHKQLLELSENYNDGQLYRELDESLSKFSGEELVNWANERFDVQLNAEELSDSDTARDRLKQVGREFLRSELSDLERYVLIQGYDGAWKEHLYAMDHLKSSIWMRSMAEKDPKIEYKREGHRMFNEMLEGVEDKVTDVIFKVQLAAGDQARSVYNVSRAAHDEVSQFTVAERQRAAAQAPQGEKQVKKIQLDTPKVGRNEPCPCGSGKKYKKCCGAGE